MNPSEANSLISGMLLFGYLVVAIFFLRFWTRTHDRLFAIFSVAFGLLAIQRFALSLSPLENENLTHLYIVRLLAFLLIVVAIVDKNRA